MTVEGQNLEFVSQPQLEITTVHTIIANNSVTINKYLGVSVCTSLILFIYLFTDTYKAHSPKFNARMMPYRELNQSNNDNSSYNYWKSRDNLLKIIANNK